VGKLSCESCGANLDPSHVACPFCNAPTPYARERHRQEERARQQQSATEATAKQRYDAASRSNAQMELDRLARQSVVWAAIGVVFCWLPIPTIVSLILVWRARSLARANGFVFPTMATVGLVLSVTSLFSTVGLYVIGATSHPTSSSVTPSSSATSPAHPSAPVHIPPHHPAAEPSAAPAPTPSPKPTPPKPPAPKTH
jgi:hypothetical protein